MDAPSVGNDAPLYPPTVRPPDRPLSPLPFLYHFVRNPLHTLPRLVYHDLVGVQKGTGGTLAWIMDPSLIEAVLLKKAEFFSKPPLEMRVFGPALGEGLLTSQGETWRRQRKAASPAFRHSELLAYVPAMTKAAEKQLATWQTLSGPQFQPVDVAMGDITFDVITRTVFAGCDVTDGDIIKAAAADYLDGITWEIAFGIFRLPIWLWHPRKSQLRKAAQRLRSAVGRVLDLKMANSDYGSDLLGRLIAAQGAAERSRERLIDNLATFLIAGHETTAKALTWTLYLLARAPHWQQRVREEVLRIVGETGPVEAQHIEALKVTGQVLKESMRLYPPAPVLTRMANDNIRLNDLELNARAMLLIPIYALHRHHRLWNDPDRFDPARFTPEREATYHRAQFIPFGFGPRICIGQAFAMIEATVILATLVRAVRFGWDGRHLPEPVSRVTLRPSGGMPLRIEMV